MDEPVQSIEAAAPPPRRRWPSRLGIVGFVCAFLALLAAMLQPTVREGLRPPPKPADQAIAEVGGRLKDRVIAKLKREKYVAAAPQPVPESDRERWLRLYPAGIALLSAGAIGIGAVGLVRKRDARLNAATLAIALLAVAFERVVVAIGVTIGVLVLLWLLSALGGA